MKIGFHTDACLGGFVIPWADAGEVAELAAVAEEYGWDGIYAEVSSDGGASWQHLDTLAYPGITPGTSAGCAPQDSS